MEEKEPLLTERSIINFLIWTSGLIVGPYVALTAISGNYAPTLCLAGLTFLILTFVVVRDRLFIFPLLGLTMTGKLNFLPAAIAPSDIGFLILIFYYAVTYVALKQKIVRSGPLIFLMPMLVICAIVLYHNHDFGLRVLGSDSGLEGSRPGIFVLLAALAYLCGISVAAPSVSFMAKIPLYCFVVSVLSSIPFTITTYVPSLAPYVWLVSDNINASAYFDSQDLVDTAGNDIIRASGGSSVAYALMAILVAYYPINTWWRPRRWFVPILALVCVLLVVNGGFRSVTVVFGLMIFASAWCHISWRSLVVLPVIVFIGFMLSVGQQYHLYNLPLSAQRGLAFLPGEWDPSVTFSTDASNDFRDRIKTVYAEEYLAKSPLVGNGFAFNTVEFDRLTYLAEEGGPSGGYYQAKEFITGKMFHIGWISVYDAVGVIGFMAFIAFGMSLLLVSGWITLGRGVDHQAPLFPLKVWLFANMFSGLIGYFTVFGSFSDAFKEWCAQAIIVYFLWKLEQTPELEFAPLLHQKAPDLTLVQESVPA